jgi:hypothetical protein
VEKVRLEILGLSASHAQSGSFAMVLGEEGGSRRLPIIIGMFEAQAIAVEMEKITSNRPMTHDLFRSFAKQFDVVVTEVIISDLREGVFYAKIICSFRDGTHYAEIDARPSDAVAIGLRFEVGIYASEQVMQEAGITLSEADEESSGLKRPAPRTPQQQETPSVKMTVSNLHELPNEKLESMMQEAIDNEDYERAAKIRDELNKRQ